MIQIIPYLALTAMTAMAQAYPHSCFRERTRIVDQTFELRPEVPCTTTPLNLKTRLQFHPQIRSGTSIPVRYYAGGWSKPYKQHVTYRVDFEDICWPFDRIPPQSYSYSYTFDRELRFELSDTDNPNLNSDIRESFQLSPLTKEEATNKFKALEATCRSATL